MNWDLLGHEWAVTLLQRHIQQDAVRHAYLFCGPPGVGRRSLALRFTQALYCPTPPAPGEPCRACRTCQQVERQQHPDLAIVEAESEGREIKVEQVRELQHSLSLAPYQASYRVALLRNLQDANPNAQNAMLKTLEEAPTKVILLVTASSPESLLPTIVSRCEVMRLRPLPLETVAAHLRARVGLPETEARLLAHLSGGRLGYALRLHNDPAGLERRQALLDAVPDLLKKARRGRFAYVELLLRERDKQRPTLRLALETWSSYWRDVLLVVSQAQSPLTNLDRTAEIQTIAAQVDLATAHRMVSGIDAALDKLDRNVNTRLLGEVLLLDWPYLS